jgi:hypothetical protein
MQDQAHPQNFTLTTEEKVQMLGYMLNGTFMKKESQKQFRTI